MDKRQEKIQMLEARLIALREEQKRFESVARARESKAARAVDTRRKILLGAYLLERAGGSVADTLVVQGLAFADWLTRDTDRALFDLPQARQNRPPTSPPHSISHEAGL